MALKCFIPVSLICFWITRKYDQRISRFLWKLLIRDSLVCGLRLGGIIYLGTLCFLATSSTSRFTMHYQVSRIHSGLASSMSCSLPSNQTLVTGNMAQRDRPNKRTRNLTLFKGAPVWNSVYYVSSDRQFPAKWYGSRQEVHRMAFRKESF